jgi:hypothetical protein
MEVPSIASHDLNFGAPRVSPRTLHHERLTQPPSRLTRLSKSSNSPGLRDFFCVLAKVRDRGAIKPVALKDFRLLNEGA